MYGPSVSALIPANRALQRGLLQMHPEHTANAFDKCDLEMTLHAGNQTAFSKRNHIRNKQVSVR